MNQCTKLERKWTLAFPAFELRACGYLDLHKLGLIGRVFNSRFSLESSRLPSRGEIRK